MRPASRIVSRPLLQAEAENNLALGLAHSLRLEPSSSRSSPSLLSIHGATQSLVAPFGPHLGTDEGLFTASYKSGLLVALAEVAIEDGDDSGAALPIPTRILAELFIRLYWRQVRPYCPWGASVPGGSPSKPTVQRRLFPRDS